MSEKLKKHKYMGSYGARYGLKIKKMYNAIEEAQRAPHPCPNCGFKRVKRTAAGVYYCRKCDEKFAGGAFIPQTLVGQTVSRIVRQGVSGTTAVEEVEKARGKEEGVEAKEETPKKAKKQKKAKEEQPVEEESEEIQR